MAPPFGPRLLPGASFCSDPVQGLAEVLPRLEVGAVHDAPPAAAERAEVAGVLADELPERAAADAEVVHDFFAGQRPVMLLTRFSHCSCPPLVYRREHPVFTSVYAMGCIVK